MSGATGSPAEVLLWLLVALPGTVGGTLAAGRPRAAYAVPVSLVSAALTTVAAVIVAVQRPQVGMAFVARADFAFGVDALSALVVPAVAAVTLLVLVFSAAEIRESQARFHGLMLLFSASALLTATATTVVTLLFAWEIMGATSYALIGFWWRDDSRVSSGLTAFVTTRAADLGLYVAAGAALAGTVGMPLADLGHIEGGWRDVAAAGILVAAFGKAAQLPFSFWLSRAMAGPSPVSALLHSAAMVAMGGYLLLRVEPLLTSTGWAGPAASWVGVLTAVLMGIVALAQRDLKQLLAASTSAQLGFVVVAAGVGTVAGGATHLVAHASTKALLFLGAGAWLTALGTKQLVGLQGVARRWPLLGWAVTAGALALAGVPPMSLWATKDAVLAAALRQSPALYAAGLLASALSAAYAGKILGTIWRRVPAADVPEVDADHDSEQRGSRGVGRWEVIPLVMLALGAVVLGILALPPVAGRISEGLGEPEPTVIPLELVVSAALAILVALLVGVLAARARLPEPRWPREWLGLERVAYAIAVRPTLRLAETLAGVDDRVIDHAVTATGSGVVRLARRAAHDDVGWIDGTVERVARGARRLGELARRPQTGLLHQYYVQAVAILAVGAFLVLLLR